MHICKRYECILTKKPQKSLLRRIFANAIFFHNVWDICEKCPTFAPLKAFVYGGNFRKSPKLTETVKHLRKNPTSQKVNIHRIA